MSTQRLVIGTRGSLLAMAQSRQIAELIHRNHPGIAVDIVPIQTRGDRDQRTPLHQVNDPGFFSDELDEALTGGRVDLAVHSLKDLPSERPEAIAQVAFPVRDNPRDVVLFHPRVESKLKQGQTIHIGSSSLRRLRVTERFLATALPSPDHRARLRFANLRGSVEDRVAQLYQGAAVLDGVIVALAGLNRLWMDPDGRRRLEPLFESLRIVVLPLNECPTAPGQGVLAVECRREDPVSQNLLAALDSHTVRDAVQRERSYWCAQGFGSDLGATAQSHPALGELLFTGDGLTVELPPKPHNPRPFDGGQVLSRRRPLPLELTKNPGGALFLAHWAALPSGINPPPDTRIWVSGVNSWRRIAARGLWVEGCAEHLGFEFLTRTLSAPALRLPALREWTVFTHRAAVESWHDRGIRNVLASYELVEPDGRAGIAQAVAAASHFFWGSPQQFDNAQPWLPDGAHHACGPGKTAAHLKALGIEALTLFPSRHAWQLWLA